VTTRVPRLQEAVDGAAVQEAQLRQVEDDGCPRSYDLVDLVLKVLNRVQVEIASEDKGPDGPTWTKKPLGPMADIAPSRS
jgi:hypothetical protein